MSVGTELLARSYYLEMLLRDRVLPPLDNGEQIRGIRRHNGPARIRYRLAEADD
jgi:hypothetical protein